MYECTRIMKEKRERERRKKMKKMSFEVVACQYERTQSKTTLDDIKLPTKYYH